MENIVDFLPVYIFSIVISQFQWFKGGAVFAQYLTIFLAN